MSKKKSNEKNLIKYSITLFIVAIIFISIGCISLSRNGNDRFNSNAEENAKQISSENTQLKEENRQLKEKISSLDGEIDTFKKEKETIEKEKAVLEAEKEAYKLYIEAEKIEDINPEEYEKIMEQILSLEISEELKNELAVSETVEE